MLQSVVLENVLFIDIETVPLVPRYEELPGEVQELWSRKSVHLQRDGATAAEVYARAGIYAEFGRVICISAGYIVQHDGVEPGLKIKSFYAEDEALLLKDFAQVLVQFYRAKKGRAHLCAHNGKEFDFPYIARRMLVHGVALPQVLEVHGQKPWTTTFLDTMELWKFGDYKHYTSLALLAHVFGLPTPKNDMDGAMVAQVYYQEQDLPRIVQYCEADVLTVARLFLRFRGDTGTLLQV